MIRFFSTLNLAILAGLALVTLAGMLLVPEEMRLPVHWNGRGEVDGTLPRNWALAQIPFGIAIVWALFWLRARFMRPASEEPAAVTAMSAIVSGLTALLVLMQGLVVLYGVGVPVNGLQAFIIGAALLEIGLGTIVAKAQPGRTLGIRIPTTEADPANWAATHRMAGAFVMVAGVGLLAAAAFLPLGSWLLIAAVVAWIAPFLAAMLYSLWLARRS